jgi:hypothetical protein
VIEWLTLLLRIQDISRSNLGPDTGYPERVFVAFLSLSRQMPGVRFQVLTAASMMFRIVFWDVLQCKIIVDNYFARQYIPEDNSEQNARRLPQY